MKNFIVTIPFTGVISVEIEAETQEEAESKALNECDLKLDWSSELGYDLDEWETHKKIVQGNICYANQSEINSQEV